MRLRTATWLLALSTSVCACGAAAPSRAHAEPGVDRESGAALFDKGRAAAQLGDSIRAEEYLRLAMKRGLEPRETLSLLIAVCVSNMHLRAALEHANSYLVVHPEDDRLRYLVATILVALGRKYDARSELDRLLRHHAESSDAHFLLGVLDADTDVVEARAHFRRYLALAPHGARAAEVASRLVDLEPSSGRFPERKSSRSVRQ